MSDLNAVPATKIASGSQPAQTPGAAAKIAARANFWDLMLTKIDAGSADAASILTKAQAAAAAPAVKTTVTASSQASGKGTDNPLALLQVALAGQTVDENGNIVLPGAKDDVKDLQTQLNLVNTMINHLKNALPENADKEGIFAQVLAKLQGRSDSLQANIIALESGSISKDTPIEDIPTPTLISLGLTPAEIAQVSDTVKALQQKLGRDVTIDDLLSGLGGMLTPAQFAKVDVKTDAGLNIDDASQPTDDLAAKLNALEVGSGKTSADQAAANGSGTATTATAATDINPFTGRALTAGEKIKAGRDQASTDDGIVKALKPDAAAPVQAPIESQVKKSAASFKENLMNMLNANQGTDASGDILVPASFFSSDAGSNLLQQMGLQTTSSTTLGPVAQAANITTGAAAAGQPNPATQLVAATMTKAGKEGVADTVTIRLDPPELGTVNVRLEFGKDKSVKAHLLVEKPETYMMLQRDGASLERALQNAGLDANNASISFELSSQGNGNNFNSDNNGQGGGERNAGGSSPSEGMDDGADTIKSTMNWQVDTTTGHVRYNIFA